MAKFVLTAQLQLQAPKNVGRVVNQIQQQLKGVTVDVEAKGTANAQRQIEKVRKETDKAAKSADRMGKAFAVSIRRFTALAIATRAVSLFSNSLGGAVKEAISFERELVKISQVTGKTMGDLRDLTDTITGLSRRFGVASSSLLNVSRILSQAGFDAKQTEIALSTLARTELAPTFDNITQTAEGAVAIFNQFRKGAEALETQLGAINAVAGKFAVEAGDLISVLRRAGGVFKASGGELNELIALFTSVRSTTRESADSIATGLRTIFTRIQRPRTIEFLKQFGVELVDLEGKFVGPFEASMRLGQALAGLEQGDTKFIKIAEELGGFRQIGKVIPLLQQTRVAQEALNVAQGGANSLASDAAKAQQTLAVRLDQTQQKFIALIRSISETYSFQLMASAALAIADSIVKIGEAIKPVLPLITALAAVKLVKGAGIFGGALAGRGVQGFAGGGMVPGTGNGDTVPAMLTPGEFVIRKQSVNKIGADRLASINRYASGGQVKVEDGTTGAFFLRPEQGVDRSIDLAKEPQGSIKVSNRSVLQRLGYKTTSSSNADLAMLNSIPSAKGLAIAIRGKAGGAASKYKDFLGGNINEDTELPKFGGGTIKARDALKDPEIRKRVAEQQGAASSGGREIDLVGSLSAFFPGKNDLENSAVSKGITKRSQRSLKSAVKTGAMSVIKSLKNKTLSFNQQQVDEAALNLSTDSNALTTTSGFVYEGIIQALTGAKLQGKQANWDFLGNLSNFGSGLGGLFSAGADSFKRLIRADAKRTNSSKSRESIIKKIESDINKNKSSGYTFIAKKAAGGGISGAGTDTVPALLTPGEFVVNKKSAQAIGYGTLGRMNKVGKYAKGGIVQRFEDGGPVPGDKGFIGPLSAGQIKDIKTAKIQRNLSKLGVAAFATTTALNGMLPAVQETDGSLLRLVRGVTNATTTTVGSIGALGFALQGLGDKFSIGNLIKGKFTGPVIAAGASAMFISSAFESVVDATRRFEKALKEGTREEAIGLATKASTSSARSAGTIGAGVGLAGAISLLGGPFTLALAGGAAAAAAFAGSAYKFSDGFQDLLSGLGYETSDQIKSQAAANVATRNFTVSLKEASENAKTAFIEAKKSGRFADESEKTFSKVIVDLDTLLKEDVKTGNAAATANRPEEYSTLFRIATFIASAMSSGGRSGVGGFSAQPQGPVANNRLLTETEEYNKKFNVDIKKYFAETQNFVGSIDDVTKKFVDAFPKESKEKFATAIKNMNEYASKVDEAVKAAQPFFNNAFRAASLTNSFNFQDFEKSTKTIETLNKSTVEANQTRLLIGATKVDPRLTKDERAKEIKRLEESLEVLEGTVDSSRKSLAKMFKEVAENSPVLGDSLKHLASQLTDIPASELTIAITNIKKSIIELQKRFRALNLGLSDFDNFAAGANLAIRNFVDSAEGNTSSLERAFSTLQLGLSNNATGVPNNVFNSALGKILNTLEDNNASPRSLDTVDQRLRASRRAVTSLEAFRKSFDPLSMESLQQLSSAQSLQTAFADFSEDLIQSMTPSDRAIIEQIRSSTLDEEAIKKLNSLDLTGLQSSVKNITDEQLKQLDGIKQLIGTQKVELEVRKKSIQREKAAEAAQRKFLQTQMTVAREIGTFGGKIPSVSDRLENLAKRTDTVGGGVGSQKLFDEAMAIQQKRLQGDGIEPKEAAAQAQRIDQLRDMLNLSQEEFKVRQEEINIIRQKNSLERSSQDALLRGDVGTLFKNFQTQTAIDVGLSGDARLAGQVESEAFVNAMQRIDSLIRGGASEIQGVPIREALEKVAFTAFTRSGVPNARGAAQRRAGTDPESLAQLKKLEEAGKKQIDLSGKLSTLAESMTKLSEDIMKRNQELYKVLEADMEARKKIFVDPQFEQFNRNIQDLSDNGLRIKTEQNVNLTLMGGELLAEIKRFDSQLVANEISEAFSRAKIDDNGRIILG